MGAIGNEYTKPITVLAQHGYNAPRDLDGATATVEIQIDTFRFAHLPHMVIHRPHGILADVGRCALSVAADVRQDARIAEFFNTTNYCDAVIPRHVKPPVAKMRNSKMTNKTTLLQKIAIKSRTSASLRPSCVFVVESRSSDVALN